MEYRFSDSLVVNVVTDDLFLLCSGRAVRWLSRGFMSGGISVIFRNTQPNHSEVTREMK